MRRFAGVLLLAALAFFAACSRGPRVEILAPDGSHRATVRVEVADDRRSREVGLMYRQHLDSDAGMLFVFAAPSHQSFWMKNTVIPLDLLFADSSLRIVGIIANAEPYSEAFLSVPADSQYVLEVNGGFCKDHGIQVHDRLEFAGFPPRSRD